MENRKRKFAVGAAALVAALGIGGVVIGGGSPAVGTVDPSGVTIMMTIDRAGTTTDLGWGQSTNSVCNSALGGHAIELISVTGGVDGGGSTTAPAKLQYRPVVITKAIDSATGPVLSSMASPTGATTPVNVHIYFYPHAAATAPSCAIPEMKIDLIGAIAKSDVVGVDQGSAKEALTLSYGLESLRTASRNSAGALGWDNTGGFCWSVLRNVSCSPASVPVNP